MQVPSEAMGIPMIHADAQLGQKSSTESSDLQVLLNRRTEIEAALDSYGAILDRNGIDMRSPLITAEGYPRSDIDVANVRIARTAIIRLKNDYKDLERQIETAVHEAFKNGTPLKIERGFTPVSQRQEVSAALSAAFCYIASVVVGSPADTAGLQKDDKIITFGTTTLANNDRLRGLALEVNRAVAQNLVIKVTLVRNTDGRSSTLTKDLKPNTEWGGRGAVGAHFMPV